MKSNPSIRRLVCQSCGLALTRDELDRARDDIRDRFILEDPVEAEKKKKQDYLNWLLKRKEEREAEE
ncbi:MAG: hypothetical protein RBG13Loki_3949 [Promethearchaeota archaeon CR_4]|nr:MAG: hypothetical protein RBG13Loki_3949 [Candidatus Lokiarchaeota archaeon CR_4]